MLYSRINPSEIRKSFRIELTQGKLMRFPGAFSALSARLIQDKQFEGIYVSGAVISASLGLPDIGLTTLTEVTRFSQAISKMTDLPTIVDADTGFGEINNIARTVQEFEDAGVTACHLEDQVNPKRCGHLDNKELIDVKLMSEKIRAANISKRDKNFMIIARTDARGVEGLDKAIDRAKAYVDAGAEAIFPEALHDEKDFAAFRQALNVPLIANMTEFGKSKLLTCSELEKLGYNIVIFPVTLLRIAMGAVENALDEIISSGTQESLVKEMQSRARLYELIDYQGYASFDKSIYNFNLKNNK